MKYTFIIAGIIAALFILMYLAGLALPVTHTATVKDRIPATPQLVWDRITRVREFPQWRRNLKEVIVLNDTEWAEVGDHRTIPMKCKELVAAQKLVGSINSTKLPFGGEWVYELKSDGDGTLLTITENGAIYNPLFRFIAKFIMGYDTTIKQYTEDLKKSFRS